MRVSGEVVLSTRAKRRGRKGGRTVARHVAQAVCVKGCHVSNVAVEFQPAGGGDAKPCTAQVNVRHGRGDLRVRCEVDVPGVRAGVAWHTYARLVCQAFGSDEDRAKLAKAEKHVGRKGQALQRWVYEVDHRDGDPENCRAGNLEARERRAGRRKGR